MSLPEAEEPTARRLGFEDASITGQQEIVSNVGKGYTLCEARVALRDWRLDPRLLGHLAIYCIPPPPPWQVAESYEAASTPSAVVDAGPPASPEHSPAIEVHPAFPWSCVSASRPRLHPQHPSLLRPSRRRASPLRCQLTPLGPMPPQETPAWYAKCIPSGMCKCLGK